MSTAQKKRRKIQVFCGRCSGAWAVHSHRSSPVCRGCGRCKDCGCRCTICPTCHKKHGQQGYCQVCGRCKSICECRKRPGFFSDIPLMRYSAGTVSKSYGFRGGTIINPLSRPLGLEIELAEWGDMINFCGSYMPGSKIHDGSVRPSGYEYVTNPMVGDNFIRGVLEFCEAAKDSGASVNETCGLHVHVDASDYSYWDLRRFLYLYNNWEADLYHYFVTPERQHNRFCNKIDEILATSINRAMHAKTNSDLKDILQQAILGVSKDRYKTDPSKIARTLADIKRNKYGGGEGTRARTVRYFGLNIFSWFYRGSLEFRMKEGTLDLYELMYWPLLCAWMVEIATRISDHTAMKMPSLVNFLRYGIETNSIGGTKLIQPPDYLYTWALAKLRTTNN